jgi:hypothetical protein
MELNLAHLQRKKQTDGHFSLMRRSKRKPPRR